MITGQVIGKEIDQNGNIKVKTEYTLTDGSKVIGHTRYNAFNFSREKTLEDIKSHCENLMRKIYNLKKCQELINADISDVKYECKKATIDIKPAIKDYVTGVVTPAETMEIDDK